MIEVISGAKIRGRRDISTQHQPLCHWLYGFDILFVSTNISNVRESKGDDLPGVGRVGQYLLITGDGSVKTNLTNSCSNRAHTLPLQYGSIRKHQNRVRGRAYRWRGKQGWFDHTGG